MPHETRAVLDLMIHRFEAGRAAPWKLGLTPERLEAMVGAIVGFRIRVKRIDAKFKLSQNRTREDRRRVAAGLDGEGYADAAATAAWMRAMRTNEPRPRRRPFAPERRRAPSTPSAKAQRGQVEQQVWILIAAPDRVREQRRDDQADACARWRA